MNSKIVVGIAVAFALVLLVMTGGGPLKAQLGRLSGGGSSSSFWGGNNDDPDDYRRNYHESHAWKWLDEARERIHR